MIPNIEALTKACENLHVPHSHVDENKNVLRLDLDRPTFFSLYSTPFNNDALSRIARDKYFTYLILKGHVAMPKTISYLDPKVPTEYQEYVTLESLDDIANDIDKNIGTPAIVKKNMGTLGRNVFLASSGSQVRESVERIFDQEARYYDYIALGQKRVDIKREWRAIALGGNIELVYEKDLSNAEFVGNLSPLHWDNAKAVPVEDTQLIEALQQFASPIFELLPLVWAGLDIAEDKSGKLWLIEVNTKPGFRIFARDNGVEPLIPVYERALKLLLAQNR